MKVIVIGGGAGGMNAALCLKNAGLETVLIEKSDKLGKKLLATGNGKCNLSNEDMRPEFYNDPNFIKHCLTRYNSKKIRDYYLNIGIMTYVDGGRIYPYSNSSQNVLDILCGNLKRSKVEILSETEVKEVKKNINGQYTVTTDGGELKADCVIYSGGSAAGNFFSFNPLALKSSPIKCGLCPMTVSLSDSKFLDGTRVKARLSVRLTGNGSTTQKDGNILKTKIDNDNIFTEDGEVQFKDGILSGIVNFNTASFLSRRGYSGADVYIDFLPQDNAENIALFIKNSQASTAFLMLAGLLPRGVCMNILYKCGIDFDFPPSGLTEKQIDGICVLIKNMKFKAKVMNDLHRAQVAVGGIDTDQINPETFEVKTSSGLYVTGEALNIDGLCGGYNLHFAVASALCAVESIVNKYGKHLKG